MVKITKKGNSKVNRQLMISMSGLSLNNYCSYFSNSFKLNFSALIRIFLIELIRVLQSGTRFFPYMTLGTEWSNAKKCIIECGICISSMQLRRGNCVALRVANDFCRIPKCLEHFCTEIGGLQLCRLLFLILLFTNNFRRDYVEMIAFCKCNCGTSRLFK